jgi:hypothetical protein
VVISAERGPVLDLDSAHMATMRLLPTRMSGDVNLRGCQVTLLDDRPGAWYDTAGMPTGVRHLDGWQVRSVSREASASIGAHLDLLAETGVEHDRAASRSTYRSLATAYARSGHDQSAIALRREARRHHDSAIVRWALAPVQQGDAPQRALFGLLMVVLITTGVVGFAHGQQWLTRSPSANGQFSAIRYAIESVLPMVNFHATSGWSLDTSSGLIPRSGADIAAIWMTMAPILGMAAIALFAAGLFRMVIEERRHER